MDVSTFEKIFKNRKPRSFSNYRYFSVLVPLVYVKGTAHLLFEVRSSNLKRQPNEVCFPGGKVEANETPEACALRETSEELCIPIEKMKIISELDYIITYSNFTMYSYLGVLEYEDVQSMHFNKSEVKDVFLVPFDFFINAKPLSYEAEVGPIIIGDDFPYHLIQNGKNYNWRKGKIPIFIYQYQDKVIWGLTARIIENMVGIIKNRVE